MKRAYIITFDNGPMRSSHSKDFDPKKLHKELSTANGVVSWWHYLEYTYIIIVDAAVTAKNVGDFIRKVVPNKQFIVGEFNLHNTDGWLNKEAWDWIGKWTLQVKSTK